MPSGTTDRPGAVVRVSDVVHTFGEVRALDGVSLASVRVYRRAVT